MRTETEAVRARKELESKFEEEKKNLLQTMEGKVKRIDHLLQENDLLEEEFLTREVESLILMQIVAEKNFDHEKVRLLQGMEEKSCTIEDFKLKHASLEQCIASTTKLSVSALDEKHSSLSLKGKNAAMVLCWLLGNGCLFAWNGMLTSQDYYVTLFPDNLIAPNPVVHTFKTTVGALCGLVYRLGAQGSCDIRFVRLSNTFVTVGVGPLTNNKPEKGKIVEASIDTIIISNLACMVNIIQKSKSYCGKPYKMVDHFKVYLDRVGLSCIRLFDPPSLGSLEDPNIQHIHLSLLSRILDFPFLICMKTKRGEESDRRGESQESEKQSRECEADSGE
ncbi:hypothetical protein Syun_026075 [Stephania yunnanensis]|uniref:Uncharacterized protein n=1 Tax=Stephania yunnanensis TaxID=152371 RepID=A0AAP0HWP8_9MAGN